MQDLALVLVELHEVRTGPPLKPVKVPLGGIPSFQCVNRITELGVIGKLGEGAFNPTVQVANKNVKQHQSQYRPLRNTTHHWSTLGVADSNSLSVTIQPIPCPPSGPSVKSMSLQFRDKDVVRDSVKCFTQVQVDIRSSEISQLTGLQAPGCCNSAGLRAQWRSFFDPSFVCSSQTPITC